MEATAPHTTVKSTDTTHLVAARFGAHDCGMLAFASREGGQLVFTHAASGGVGPGVHPARSDFNMSHKPDADHGFGAAALVMGFH